MSRLIAMLALAATASGSIDCENGNACTDSQTCVSDLLGGGIHYGCAPSPKAEICADMRFSCPFQFSCDEVASECSFDNVTVPMMTNVAAVRQSNSTLRDGDGACEEIASYTPSFCTCTDEQHGFNLACSVNVLGVDSIGLSLDAEPCADPAQISLDVIDSKLGIDYPIKSIKAGTTEQIGIPGLSVNIPKLGKAGIVMDISLEGNLESLEIDLGVDACIGKKLCGSKLTHHLPIKILDGTFSFGNLCGNSTK